MDRRIKFRHLNAFSTIARAGSLKRAAEQMNLTQPAISKALKELEEIIGVVLLARSRAGVQLTAEGEIFLQFAEQSISALRHGLRNVRATGLSAGKLRVGALPSVVSHLLPRAVSDFGETNPDTLLELHEGPHQDLVTRLRNGGLDLVVGRLGRPETMTGLEFLQLYTEQVVVVAHPDSPAVSVRQWQDLDRFRVLYPPQDSAIRSLIARLLISQGVPLFTNRIESASSAFGRAVTLADPQTVWVISYGVVAGELAEGRLVALDLDTSATTGAVGIMSRSQEVRSVVARAFISALLRAAPDAMA
ncbi:pca operon transcription factor PcaQ [Yoonia sp. TsM2_T14_4]|uniref:pca operon transcription factor PcaQ n=1 Tax=Yoonia sp. TsM2_T14_4 TaxID=3415141 RepID=UPI003C774927